MNDKPTEQVLEIEAPEEMALTARQRALLHFIRSLEPGAFVELTVVCRGAEPWRVDSCGPRERA